MHFHFRKLTLYDFVNVFFGWIPLALLAEVRCRSARTAASQRRGPSTGSLTSKGVHASDGSPLLTL